MIIGIGRSAIGTLVERSSRFTMLLHLPPLPERDGPRIKNGPAVTGAGAQAVRDAIVDQLGELPEHLRRSLTWGQGAELAQHARLKIDLGLEVYFCDPQSPWQRGTNENTNGYSASTSRNAPTCRATAPATWLPAPTRSTAARARRSTGAPPPRSSTSTPPPRPDGRRLQRPPAPRARVARVDVAAAASP